jgi:hypothetical protein
MLVTSCFALSYGPMETFATTRKYYISNFIRCTLKEIPSCAAFDHDKISFTHMLQFRERLRSQPCKRVVKHM